MVVTWAYDAPSNTATASGAGTTNFAGLVAADVAGGWGKFTADTSGTQIKIAGKIVVGDGTNACAFSDSGKQVYAINLSLEYNTPPLIDVKSQSSFTLGVLVDATTYRTKSGCALFLDNSGYWEDVIYGRASSTVYLYSSLFYSTQTGGSGLILSLGTGRIWNCILSNMMELSQFNGDIYNVLVQKSNAGLESSKPTNCIGLFVTDQYNSSSEGAAINIVGGSGTYTFTSPKTVNCQYSFRAESSSGTVNIINDSFSSWGLYWKTSTSLTLNRQYQFDLQVCDNAASVTAKSVVAIANASVTLQDVNGNTIFTTTTDANGNIATQTITRGYYNQTNGNTLQDYGPHYLYVTASGYEDYEDEIIFSEKVKYQVSMNLPGVPANLASATPSDVATGKTFFGKLGSEETGTLIPVVVGGGVGGKTVTKTRTVYRDNPADEPLMMLTAVLLIKNRVLKRRISRIMLMEKYKKHA